MKCNSMYIMSALSTHAHEKTSEEVKALLLILN